MKIFLEYLRHVFFYFLFFDFLLGEVFFVDFPGSFCYLCSFSSIFHQRCVIQIPFWRTPLLSAFHFEGNINLFQIHTLLDLAFNSGSCCGLGRLIPVLVVVGFSVAFYSLDVDSSACFGAASWGLR